MQAHPLYRISCARGRFQNFKKQGEDGNSVYGHPTALKLFDSKLFDCLKTSKNNQHSLSNTALMHKVTAFPLHRHSSLHSHFRAKFGHEKEVLGTPKCLVAGGNMIAFDARYFLDFRFRMTVYVNAGSRKDTVCTRSSFPTVSHYVLHFMNCGLQRHR